MIDVSVKSCLKKGNGQGRGRRLMINVIDQKLFLNEEAEGEGGD